MRNDILFAAAGLLVGLMAGARTGSLMRGRTSQSVDQLLPEVAIDPVTEKRINDAAREWATAEGIPEAESLIARKIRLGLTLQARRLGRSS
jgi:hypothetical protein